MSTPKSRKLFVNLIVSNLDASVAFFTKLGFTFNAQFTNEKATCMIVSEEAYFMLLVPDFFKTFTDKPLSNAKERTEGIYALSCESRAEVDDLFKKAIDAGGSPAKPAQDLGFMYSQSFYDLDGHHFEVLWMDPAQVQAT